MKATLPNGKTMAEWLQMGMTEYTGIYNFPFHPSDNAPNSYKDLKAWSENHVLGSDSLPVYSGGSGKSIYGSPKNNYLFRAWHDAVHIKEGLDFTLKSEVKVCNVQCAVLRYLGAPYAVVKALQFDVEGQAHYYAITGKYVEDQILFVNDCFAFGMDTVLHFSTMGARY